MKKVILPVLVGIAGLALLLLAVGGALDVSNKPVFIQGEIDATRVDVSAKISGRVAEQAVRDGAQVAAGELLLVLDSPELQARVRQAEANLAAARAQLEKVRNGTRVEEVRQAENAHAEAVAALTVAEQTFARIKRLHDARAISSQNYDEAKSQLDMAREREKRARAAMDMAHAGARAEDEQAVDAQARLAEAKLAEVESMRADVQLRSPINGEVNKVLVRQGELVSAGYPLVTLVDLNDVWAVVQLREEYLTHIRMGETFKARVPALGDREVTFRVTYIAPLGAFATWRATNGSGSFGLTTFEIHGQPVESVPGLRPGMSVIFDIKDNIPGA